MLLYIKSKYIRNQFINSKYTSSKYMRIQYISSKYISSNGDGDGRLIWASLTSALDSNWVKILSRDPKSMKRSLRMFTKQC